MLCELPHLVNNSLPAKLAGSSGGTGACEPKRSASAHKSEQILSASMSNIKYQLTRCRVVCYPETLLGRPHCPCEQRRCPLLPGHQAQFAFHSPSHLRRCRRFRTPLCLGHGVTLAQTHPHTPFDHRSPGCPAHPPTTFAGDKIVSLSTDAATSIRTRVLRT